VTRSLDVLEEFYRAHPGYEFSLVEEGGVVTVSGKKGRAKVFMTLKREEDGSFTFEGRLRVSRSFAQALSKSRSLFYLGTRS
jgi:hypothetical protein